MHPPINVCYSGRFFGRFHTILRLLCNPDFVFGKHHMLLPQETSCYSNNPPIGRHFGPPKRGELAGAPQIYICLIRRLKGDHYQSFLLNCGSRRVWSICRRSLPGSALLFYIISLLPSLFYRFALLDFLLLRAGDGFSWRHVMIYVLRARVVIRNHSNLAFNVQVWRFN